MEMASFTRDGLFDPKRIAKELLTTSDDLAFTAGLGLDAIQRGARVKNSKTQRRLGELVEIITQVEPRFGSRLMAYVWLRSKPLAGFSGQTAMQLLRAGRSIDILEYIDAGVYA